MQEFEVYHNVLKQKFAAQVQRLVGRKAALTIQFVMGILLTPSYTLILLQPSSMRIASRCCSRDASVARPCRGLRRVICRGDPMSN